MPLFLRDNRSVLFIHVPKAGGTTIEDFFLRNGFAAHLLDTGGKTSFNTYARCPPQHMHADALMAVLRPARVDYTFATVREPLARLVSEYRMRALAVPNIAPLPVWLEQHLKRLWEDPCLLENHLRPQVDFLMPGCEVFRIEDGFGEGLVTRIEARLQTVLESRGFGTRNRHRDSRIVVPPEDIESVRPRVREVYWRDYAAFGYPGDWVSRTPAP
jgi:hypothetical protein